MPNEIFAEDIEALLERLEGISAARVVATDAGDIDRIYITASSPHEPAKIRQMVASALMSAYSISLDGWRVRVARLRENGSPHATWRLQRIEDDVSETSARVVVELRTNGETGPRLVGTARGHPDATNRLRTAASATLAALRPVLDADTQRATIETISVVPVAGREAAIVAVSVSSSTHSALYVGAALVDANQAEAVITATIEAVGKRTSLAQKREVTMKDRREQLESMRTHYRQVRGPQRHAPTIAPESEPAGESVVTDFAQIRPERPGGAAVGGREELRQDTERMRAGKGGTEDEFFRQLVTTGARVHIRCRDGYQIPEGVLKGFGTYSLLVVTDAGEELVFKHGIISIRPLAPGANRD